MGLWNVEHIHMCTGELVVWGEGFWLVKHVGSSCVLMGFQERDGTLADVH